MSHNNQYLMKILWIASIPYVENYCVHPAPWITSLGESYVSNNSDQLTIVSLNSNVDNDKELIKDNIHYVYLKIPKGGKDLITLFKVKIRILEQYLEKIYRNYDIIHIHGIEHQFHVAARHIPLPKIISIQGIVSEYYKVLPETLSHRKIIWSLAGFYERKYASYYDNFSCRTDWDKHWVEKYSPKAKIHHIWEIIRKDFFDFSLKESGNNILFMGGLNILKGIRETIVALEVARRTHDLRLIIIGRGSEDQLNNIVKSCKLPGSILNFIEFRGPQSVQGVLNAYKQSFCLIHPSYIDNSPNSICEAQIAGLPVVASNVGGVGSLIKSDYTGILTKIDPNVIASDVVSLYEDEGRRNYIVRNAIQESRVRHDAEIIVEQTKNLYSNLLKSY